MRQCFVNIRKLNLVLALLVGLLILSGCSALGLGKSSRTWIEDQVSVVDKVYPTENLYDLFDKFPDGFTVKVSDSFDKDGQAYSRDIILIGYPDTKEIKGKVTLTQISKEELKPATKTVVAQSELAYTRTDGLRLESTDTLAELLPYKTFLFQELILNKEVLSRLDVTYQSYNSASEQGIIKYRLANKQVNTFLNLPKESQIELQLVANPSFLSGEEYSIPVSFHINNGTWHTESVENTITEDFS